VDLNEVVSNSQSELLEINALKELGAEVQDKLRQIRALKVNLEDAEKKLADLQALEFKTKTELDGLKSTEKGQKTKAIEEFLDLKHRERARIEIEMAELISPLTKALARLVKQDSSDRLELQHRRVLELLSNSPQEALNGDISEPLLELKSKVHLLGLKDRKREKILIHVGLLIKDKPLETLKAKHSEISGNITALEQELSETSHERTKLEDMLKQTSQQIEKLKADVDESEGALSNMNDLVSKEETELKAKVEKMAGGPVTWIEG
jgi:peptidoglycan hydrolase CwlO-like protein